MKLSRGLLVASVAVVTVAAIGVGWRKFSPQPKPAALTISDPTLDVRKRIDRVAAANSLQTVEQEPINIYGRCLDRLRAFALRTGFDAAAPLLREQISGRVPSAWLRRCARRLFDELRSGPHVAEPLDSPYRPEMILSFS